MNGDSNIRKTPIWRMRNSKNLLTKNISIKMNVLETLIYYHVWYGQRTITKIKISMKTTQLRNPNSVSAVTGTTQEWISLWMAQVLKNPKSLRICSNNWMTVWICSLSQQSNTSSRLCSNKTWATSWKVWNEFILSLVHLSADVK